MIRRLLPCICIIFATTLLSQEYTVSGYVKDGATGEELIGATVLIKELNTGGATNVYGFYSITVPKGTYTISYSYISYETTIKNITLDKNTRINIEMKPDTEVIEEVVVGAEAIDKNVKSTEMSVQTLSVQEVKQIPVMFGEQDVMKTLTLLPGVRNGGEASGGIYVRGGTPDQNLVLLDEAPVYSASHLLGIFSVFNSDAIKDVKLYKGGMPAEYGGRLSSAVDIKMRDGNSKEYSASGGLGLISSRLTVEGPIVKDKGSFIISGRRSYFDILIKPFQDTNLSIDKLFFYDLNMKANYRINENNKFYISGYFGRDVLDIMNIIAMDWGNTTLTFRWNHLFTPKLFLNSSLIYSNYNYEMGAGFDDMNFILSTGIRDYNIKEDLTFYYNDKNTIKLGLQSIYHTFSPGEYEIINDSYSYKETVKKKYGLESAVYIQNDRKLNKKININYGIRLTDFAAYGGWTEDENSEETYDKNKFVKNYIGLEPRVSGTFIINDLSSIKASVARTNQYINLIQISTNATPIDYWLPVNDEIKPQIGHQFALGYFRNFKENQYESSAEVYYKSMQNQIDFKEGGNTFNYSNIEDELIYGEGRSYGFEVYAKKVTGQLTGWISYTLSKTEKRFDEFEDGNWYPYKQDRNHDISIVGMYKINDRISANITWLYYTGQKATFPSAKYSIEDVYNMAVYTGRNNYTYPDYHRMDVGLNIKLKSKWAKENSLNISIYNVYNRKNPDMIYFEESEDNPDVMVATKITFFPIIPSITWNFKF